MDLFAEEYRKQLGDFSAIDWIDEASIERMRNRTGTDVPVQVNWSWEYGSEAEELRRLYEKGKHGQWNAEEDLDWSMPVSKDEWVLDPQYSLLAQLCKEMGKDEATQKAAAFDELAWGLSQLLHGEQGALQICGQLTNICEVMDEKWYAASQVIDEARHVEVMAKFIERKMGTIYPITPTIKMLLDELLAAPTVAHKTLGMQTLFEGVALGIMDQYRMASTNDLFSELIRRVNSDESRHAAFGVLVMRRVVRDAPKSQMEAMEDWSFKILEALNAAQAYDMLGTLGAKYDLDPDAVAMMVHSLPEWPEFNSLMYMHAVVPNLQRLGLITERTESLYEKCGMKYGQRGETEGWNAADALLN